jgi:hypothetical protein
MPLIPQPMNASKLVDLVAMDFFNLFACQKNRPMFQGFQPFNC